MDMDVYFLLSSQRVRVSCIKIKAISVELCGTKPIWLEVIELIKNGLILSINNTSKTLFNTGNIEIGRTLVVSAGWLLGNGITLAVFHAIGQVLVSRM